MKAIAIILALTSTALAAPFTVEDVDQAMIIQLCVATLKSKDVDPTSTMNAADFCSRWQGRMKAAAQPKPEPAPEPPK